MGTTIRDFGGRIIGYIETKPNGDKVVRDFFRRVLGTYDHAGDVTRDFYGKIVAQGDACSMLLK